MHNVLYLHVFLQFEIYNSTFVGISIREPEVNCMLIHGWKFADIVNRILEEILSERFTFKFFNAFVFYCLKGNTEKV